MLATLAGLPVLLGSCAHFRLIDFYVASFNQAIVSAVHIQNFVVEETFRDSLGGDVDDLPALAYNQRLRIYATEGLDARFAISQSPGPNYTPLTLLRCWEFGAITPYFYQLNKVTYLSFNLPRYQFRPFNRANINANYVCLVGPHSDVPMDPDFFSKCYWRVTNIQGIFSETYRYSFIATAASDPEAVVFDDVPTDGAYFFDNNMYKHFVPQYGLLALVNGVHHYSVRQPAQSPERSTVSNVSSVEPDSSDDEIPHFVVASGLPEDFVDIDTPKPVVIPALTPTSAERNIDTNMQTLFQIVISSLGDFSDGNVELVRFFGVVTNLLNGGIDPVNAASLLCAAYPDAMLHVAKSFANSIPTGSDIADYIRRALIDPVPGTTDFVVAASPAYDLFLKVRREFVGKIVCDSLFSSFCERFPNVRKWIYNYLIPDGSSVLAFVESFVASLVRVAAHIRYYFDGDFEKYMRSLDPESAALFVYSELEHTFTISGCTHELLDSINNELPRFERLVCKVRGATPIYKQLLDCLATLKLWRTQCIAKLKDGDLPFSVLFAGATRSGKSEATEVLSILVARNRRMDVRNVNVARPRPSDSYDTEISANTDVVLFQDSFRDAQAHDRREIMNLLFDLAGGQCIALTKAALAEKGMYARPPAIIGVTTNDESMVLDRGQVLENHEALAARIPYGVWTSWDANAATDPHRLRVKWHVGYFSIDRYRAGLFPYLTDVHDWCGVNLTREEMLRRLQRAYDAHVLQNDAYSAVRRARDTQCLECYNLKSMCECLHPASSVFGDGILYYSLALCLISHLLNVVLYLVMRVTAFFQLYWLSDWCLVTLSGRYHLFNQYQRRAWTSVTHYVSTLPRTIKTRADAMLRLQMLRVDRKILTIAACIVTTLAAYFFFRSQTKDKENLREDFSMSSATPSSGPNMPGFVVSLPNNVEKRCFRVITESCALNGFRVDGHSLITVAHFFVTDPKIPTKTNYRRGEHVIADVVLPELVTIDRTNDICSISTVKAVPGDDTPVSFSSDLGNGANFFVSGYSNDKQLYRFEIPSLITVSNSPALYLDNRVSPQSEYPLAPGKYVRVPHAFPIGSCGSVLYKGDVVYGYLVATNLDTRVTIFRLFTPEVARMNSVDPQSPLAPQNLGSIASLCISRGMSSRPMHPMSPFVNQEVASHWDYRMTVTDNSHARSRERRLLGPDVHVLERLSGFSHADIAESTGASGVIPGIDHKVSPMEHFFINHKIAQSRPTPILDIDPLLDVKEFIQFLVQNDVVVKYRTPFSTKVALYGDGVIKGVAMDKSAGYPMCEKRDLMNRHSDGSIHAGAGLVNRIDAAYDNLIAHGALHAPLFRPFAKQGELIDRSKVLAGAGRIIMNHLGLVQMLVIRRLMLPILLNVIASRSAFGIMVGLSATNPTDVHKFASDICFEESGVQSMDLDFKKMDLSQRPRVAAIALGIMLLVARKMGYSNELQRAVSSVCYTWLFPNFIYRGDVWQSQADVWGSGTLGTDVFQSLCAWILHTIANAIFVRRQLNSPRAPLDALVDIHRRAQVRVYGDDNHRNHYPDSPSGEFIARIFLECGYLATDGVDKTRVPQPSATVSFLKRTVSRVTMDGHSVITMPLAISSIVKSLYYPLKDDHGRINMQVYSQSLCNANAEIALHGDQVFAEWHPLLSTLFTNTGMPGAGPKSMTDLYDRYVSGTLETWDSGGQLPI